MARPDKVAAVAELAEKFRSSNAAVLTEYRGLTVAQLTQLRLTISSEASYTVVKNTLTSLAAKQAGVAAFEGKLTGPTAVAFVTGDAVETAKHLRDFAKAHPALVIKGGVLDGKALSADDVRKLADLESREVLLAKLAGAMKASLSNAVYLFAAPLSQAARVIDALRRKAEADPSVLAGGAGVAPVHDAPVQDETPAAVETPAAAEAEAPTQATTEAAAEAEAEAPTQATTDAPTEAAAGDPPADAAADAAPSEG
jgi:large subunit ribosomal protein L10